MTTTTAAADTKKPGEKSDDGPAFVVVDIGKKKRKQVRRLRKGRGRLMTKVQNLVADMRADGLDKDTTIVVVVRKKRKKNSFKW